jgi:bla regulator protein blaR1
VTYADLSPLVNHLWQSTVFVAAVWTLTLTLRRNRAAVRYWLWLAASVKFLVPFSLLAGAGTQLGWRSAPAIMQPRFTVVVSEISRPFVIAPGISSATPASRTASELPAIVLCVWVCGVILGLAFWLRLLRQIRAIERAATPLHLNLPIRAISTSARLEPGVFGIWSPVLILPEGITERLTPVELEAVLAHELCHVRRRDNLTAAIHMVVEILFWFQPLVWWIRTRMVEERERACDEEVLQQGGAAEVYAEGILKVCKFYLNSPVRYVSGVTGADLKKRIEQIVANRIGRGLGLGRSMMLVTAGFVAVAGPVVVGTLNTAPGHAQSQTPAPAPGGVFEVASIKPSAAGNGGMRIQWPSDSTAPDVAKPSLPAAMQELGLKLDATKGPVEILVVKRVEKPSPN